MKNPNGTIQSQRSLMLSPDPRVKLRLSSGMHELTESRGVSLESAQISSHGKDSPSAWGYTVIIDSSCHLCFICVEHKTSFCKWKTPKFLFFQTLRNMNISNSSPAFTNIKGGTVSGSRKKLVSSCSLIIMQCLGNSPWKMPKQPNCKYSDKHIRSRNSVKNKVWTQM